METITSTAEDHLKAIWSALEWGGPPMTISGLAQRFGTSAASASDTVRRLTNQGLVSHEPYRAIELTPLGEQQAVAVVRRHRLIETFLVERLGYSWDEVHLEAESLEHASSDLLIDRIDDLLGNPSVDPHGDPIPDRSGRVRYPAGAHRLIDAPAGGYRVTRIADDDSVRLARFAADGLTTAATLTVIESDDAIITRIIVDGQERTLTEDEAGAIMVVATADGVPDNL